MIFLQLDESDARLLLRLAGAVAVAVSVTAFLMLGAVLRLAWMLWQR